MDGSGEGMDPGFSVLGVIMKQVDL